MPESPDDGSPQVNDIDFELIAESIPEIVWMAAPDGATEYFNERGTEYTGMPRSANDGSELAAAAPSG